MSAIFEENFELYGGQPSRMLEGVWAELQDALTLVTPPWEEDGREWAEIDGTVYAVRAVTGASQANIGHFQIFRFQELPSDDTIRISEVRDGSNNVILSLRCTAVGHIEAYNGSDVLVGQTSVPPITAGTSLRMQYEATFDGSTGALEVRIGTVGAATLTAVIDVSNVALPGTAQQIGFGKASSGGSRELYVKAMATYSLTGTYNSSWPNITDVATLRPNGDTAVNNMTARPRRVFGIGLAQCEAIDGRLLFPTSTNFALGTGDYTLETFVHFTALPTDTDSAVVMGQWNDAETDRSYRLRLTGPNLENGRLQFEITTDGTNSTRTIVHAVEFDFQIGHNYHIAVARESGVSRIFIDGRQQGVDVADTADYFTPTEPFALFGEQNGSEGVDGASLQGLLDEVRVTKGVARYTANFTVPTAAFPRNVGGDPDFADVSLLLGFDDNLEDESSNALTATAADVTRFQTDDGEFSYQVVASGGIYDDTYIEAALIQATGVLTVTAQPSDTETVTLGSETYTFNTVLGGANSVLIGATTSDSLDNLAAAINGGTGEGSTYGTGTSANTDATAENNVPTGLQMTATAITPGAAGNSISISETLTNGSWDDSTLTGGQDLPGATEFNIEALPVTATGVRWLGVRHRSYVSEGAASIQTSIDVAASEADGADRALTTAPVGYTDRFEEDPNTSAALTVASITDMKLKIDRTA